MIERIEQTHTGTLLQLGRYRILQKLGQGGMGDVYLAHDGKLDRRVALKVLPAERISDQDAIARFQREAKALAKLSHPGIVQAFDSEEDQGRHFLVMEYVEGQSLADLLKEKRRVGPTLAAEYVRQAALALQHAHERGLVHRDLKPSNLLLTPAGRIKVLDLGLARFLQDQVADPGRTREGTALGTPDYMAPEQFQSARDVDGRADLYALGCTLYHLLTGRVPFPGTSLVEKCRAHESQEPPPIEELCPEAPAGLVLVVRRMMAKLPADRFQHAGELAEALSLYVSSASSVMGELQQTVAWQGSLATFTVGRLPRQTSRLPWAVAGVAGLAALALGLVLLREHLFQPGGTPPDKLNGTDHTVPGLDPNVLTVAQNGPGQFRAIGEALAKVKPGQTIRVLDAAAYAETLRLDDPKRHEGVTLEAPAGATLLMTQQALRVLVVQDVANVRIKGFRFEEKAARDDFDAAFAVAEGRCAGLIFESLVIHSDGPGHGIGLVNLRIASGELPVTVRQCTIKTTKGDALSVVETKDECCRGAVLRDNLVLGAMRGFLLRGKLADLLVVGNRVRSCLQSAIEIKDLAKGSTRLLLANNTIWGERAALRVYDDLPQEEYEAKQVEFCNNLLVGSLYSDMYVVVRENKDDRLARPAPELAQELSQLWHFHHNHRDWSGKPGVGGFPLGLTDRRLEPGHLLSRQVADADFLCPVANSPLAREGAGQVDKSLPAYIGASPPPGMKPWSWDRTWKARQAP
jgi:hypothetical protein